MNFVFLPIFICAFIANADPMSILQPVKQMSLLEKFKENPDVFVSEMSEADPDVLRQILALLDGLLTTSENREGDLVANLDQKQNALNDANGRVIAAQDILAQAVRDQDAANAAVSAADADVAARQAEQGQAQTERDDAQEQHDSEIGSLNDEQAVLRQVIDILTNLLEQQPAEWNLAMNIHPSDGHDFGYGAPEWNSGTSVGNKDTAFTADFLDSEVWTSLASSIAIVRHQDGVCESVKVWKLLETKSLLDYFKNVKRHKATSGGPVYESVDDSMVGKDTDPIFGVNGDLALNWWYSNNGVRIALDGGYLSDAHANDDATHGLGNEFGGNTEGFGRSDEWWHDVANIQSDCFGGSCIIQGTDHGSYLQDGPMFGQYAIFVSEGEESKFDCDANAHLSNIAD